MGIGVCLELQQRCHGIYLVEFWTAPRITDPNGEPTLMVAIANVEVLTEKPSLVKVSGYNDGDTLVLGTVAQSVRVHCMDGGA